jgi:hypothetical protein
LRNKSLLKNHRSKELDKRTQSNDSIDIIFNKNQNENENIIKNLQDQIVKQETNHENHIKEIRNEYQNEINELKDKLNYLKNPSLNENNSEMIHEKHREQEKLIKAYQLENENLYSDLKILKEKNKLENKNFIEQINLLKFNHLQDKIKFKNLDNENKLLNKSTAQEKTNDSSAEEKLKINQDTIKKFTENESKNYEIIEVIEILKKKLQQFENDKPHSNHLKQINKLKNHIKEMESIINRLKQTIDSSNSSKLANMSIHFYEMKINELEDLIKAKDLNLERNNQLWEQKYSLLQKKINRKIIKSSEFQLINDIEKLENDENKNIECKRKEIKTYDPNEFLDKESKNSNNLKSYNDQIELLKTKLSLAENELIKSNNQHTLEINQIKKIFETKMIDLVEKHKIETEKLLFVFTGETLKMDHLSSEILNDPIQTLILSSKSDKHKQMKQTIEKQKLIIKKFNEHCNNLNFYRDKCIYLEEQNKILNEQIDEFKSKLDEPLNIQYKLLKNKIKKLEENMFKRDHDENVPYLFNNDSKLNELKIFYENQLDVKNREINKFRLEFDSMLQLLHSLQ